MTAAADVLTRPERSLALVDQPTWRVVLALAWPALCQQWLYAAVALSDRLLAGRFTGAHGAVLAATQSAQTTAVYLGWFLSCCATLVTVGAMALVARMVGAGDRDGAAGVLHQALMLAAGYGLALAGVCLLTLSPLLNVLRLDGVASALAGDYLRPLLYQLPLQMISAAGIACLAGAGDTKTGLWVLGSVTVLNIPLAWMFCRGLGPIPALGFPGIAVGTAVSQSLGCLAVVLILLRGRAGLRLRWHLLVVQPDLLVRMLRISLPAMLDTLSMQIGYMWFLGLINGMGDVAAAAHGIALTWEALGYQAGGAFGTAAVSVVGQALGADRPDRALRGGWVTFGLGATLMSLIGILFFSFAGPMFELFCPEPGQQPIVAAGVPVLRLVAFSMPALASCIILAWALRGAGDTRWPVLFTWIGFFAVRIPGTYLLTSEMVGLGLLGAWLAMAADLHVRGACVLWRFAGGRWRLQKV